MKFRIDGKYELIFEWATFKRGSRPGQEVFAESGNQSVAGFS